MDYQKVIREIRSLSRAVRDMALEHLSVPERIETLQVEAVECASRLKQIKVQLTELGVTP